MVQRLRIRGTRALPCLAARPRRAKARRNAATVNGRTTMPRHVAAFALFALLAGPLHAASPIEGRWQGEIGSEKERIVAGVEFRRADDGTVRAYLTNPTLNVYGAEAGEAKIEGERVTSEALYLDLVLKEDKLVGH